MTDRRTDLTWHKTYTAPIGRCSLNTSQEKQNYLYMHSKAFTSFGKSNKKKEQVPDVPTIKYSQGIQNSCIISSLASALYYMVDELASEYIIRCEQLSLIFINDKGRMQFCHNTLMGINRVLRKNCIWPLSWMNSRDSCLLLMIYSDACTSPI